MRASAAARSWYWKVPTCVASPEVIPCRATHAPATPCSNTAANVALPLPPVADTSTGA